MNRREFVQRLSLLGTAALSPSAHASDVGLKPVPRHLSNFRKSYLKNPNRASLEWFTHAEFGLFLHYGLFSLLEGFWKGEHVRPAEWVQYRGLIPVKEYEKLARRFTAEHFDADHITDMALEAGMKYVNITSRHHDSFCLFESKYTDFSSVNSAAKRDLVGELAEQCQRKGLGLFLYYSHGRDWRHPHAPSNLWSKARPEYNPPEL